MKGFDPLQMLDILFSSINFLILKVSSLMHILICICRISAHALNLIEKAVRLVCMAHM